MTIFLININRSSILFYFISYNSTCLKTLYTAPYINFFLYLISVLFMNEINQIPKKRTRQRFRKDYRKEVSRLKYSLPGVSLNPFFYLFSLVCLSYRSFYFPPKCIYDKERKNKGFVYDWPDYSFGYY